MKNPIVAAAAVCLSTCLTAQAVTPTEIREELFGTLADGREVKIFTLENGRGCRARVAEIGAVLVSVEVPDKAGKFADVTLGAENFEAWVTNPYKFGSTVGRFGNRIADGKFTLDGREFTLPVNFRSNGVAATLHGGPKGFAAQLWKGEIVDGGVEFSYLSKDGEEGFPGAVAVKVRYTFDAADELTWSATATTDAPTVINLLQHAYWNLSGDPETSTNDHELTLEADEYLPTNAGLIPTGERLAVAGTPLDFTKAVKVGARIGDDFPALKIAGGYDQAWVLRKGEGLRTAARLKDPASGRVMTVATDAPAMQIYTPDFNGSLKGKNGLAYRGRTAICLETEAFPDAPNHPDFPSTVLRPGETYRHTLIFKFSVE